MNKQAADGLRTASTVDFTNSVDYIKVQDVGLNLFSWTLWPEFLETLPDIPLPIEPVSWIMTPEHRNIFDELMPPRTWKGYKKSATRATIPSYPRRPLPPYDESPNLVEKMLEAYSRQLEDVSWRWDSRNRVWLDEEGRVMLWGPR
ncbi:hypothetical protein V8C26DRAFT_411150 [Trichoderma gracile]